MSHINIDFDFDAEVSVPFRMQPGLRRVPPGQSQLTPTDGEHLSEKLLVLGERSGAALLQVPGFDPAPALERLAAQARSEWPGLIQGERLGDLMAPALGWRLRDHEVEALPGGASLSLSGPPDRDLAVPVAATPVEPESGQPQAAWRADHERIGAVLAGLPREWRAAGLLSLAFQEDFAIVDATTATLPWLAVCLPSFWRPADKIGLDFAAVHAPVADAELVRKAGPALMRMVCGPAVWERFVWTLSPHPLLRAHPDHDARTPWPDPALGAGALAAACRLRHERQTFIPLPEQQQAVFTIRVAREPLARVLSTPGRAARLAAALASMSEAVLEYRGLLEVRERLLAWLASQG